MAETKQLCGVHLNKQKETAAFSCLAIITFSNIVRGDQPTFNIMFTRLIHVATCVNTSFFLWLHNIPSYIGWRKYTATNTSSSERLITSEDGQHPDVAWVLGPSMLNATILGEL